MKMMKMMKMMGQGARESLDLVSTHRVQEEGDCPH